MTFATAVNWKRSSDWRLEIIKGFANTNGITNQNIWEEHCDLKMVVRLLCLFIQSTRKKRNRNVIKTWEEISKRLKTLRRVKVIPIVTGVLSTIGQNFESWLKKIEIEWSAELLQEVRNRKVVANVLDI